ncbi:MAG: phosphatidylserine/phosphatidylglycerophosphate/cardiolipin synthase family protein [Bdellovibrionales bacterium]
MKKIFSYIGVSLLLAANTVANAQTGENIAQEQTLKLLNQELKIQNIVEALNQKYSKTFLTTEDVKLRAQNLLGTRSPSAKEEKQTYLFALKEVDILRNSQRESMSQLREYFQSNSSLLTEVQGDQRLLGIKVPPRNPLFNGTSISRAKPIDLEDRVLDLGIGTREVCLYEQQVPTGTARDVFFNMHMNDLSCMVRASNLQLLPDHVEGFQAKMKLLTGSTIPLSVIEQADPNYQLDFSKAPNYEVVLVSYLEYKNDFSGKLVSQALKWHASRGAQVRIIVPGLPFKNLVHIPDQHLLDELLQYSSNIQLQKYMFKDSQPDIITPLDMVHKTYHAKILLGLSADHPERSAAVIGGRNLKDVFLMTQKPDYSKNPEMIQYGTRAEGFTFYRDLDVLVEGREITEQIAAPFMSFWYRDMTGLKVRRMSQHVYAGSVLNSVQRTQVAENLKNQTYVRYFYSTPFTDGRTVENIYVQLINSAQKHIRMTSPYVRPVKIVAEAIRKAAARGVRVDFIFDKDLLGDNVPFFTRFANRRSANYLIRNHAEDIKRNSELAHLMGKIQMHTWTDKTPSILHAKVILIDDEVLYVGSANMNFKSMRQDIENGVLITGPTALEFQKIFDEEYLTRATPIQQQLNNNWFSYVFIKILDYAKAH